MSSSPRSIRGPDMSIGGQEKPMRKPEQLVAAPEQLAAGQERVIGGPDKAIAAPDMWIISREMSIGSGDKSMWRQEMTSRPPASAPRAPYPSIRLVNHTPRPTGSAAATWPARRWPGSSSTGSWSARKRCPWRDSSRAPAFWYASGSSGSTATRPACRGDCDGHGGRRCWSRRCHCPGKGRRDEGVSDRVRLRRPAENG
jgi:hypothetical protein